MAAVLAALVLWACSSDSKPATESSSTTSAASSVPAARPLRILVSNDDGVDAPGINALVQALIAEPDVVVTVVAPLKNQSGTGGKTIHVGFATISSVPLNP